ncbi:MAG: hypothetical protein ACM3QU_11605 [Verrucomicrobiota bacterium]
MRAVRPGLWHWEAPHPQWRPSEPWGPEVSSYAIDDGERLLLVDPLAVPGEIERLAADREAAIVLTCPWHERDARSLAERLGVPVRGGRQTGRRRRSLSRTEAERPGAPDREPTHRHRRRHARRLLDAGNGGRFDRAALELALS